MSVTANWSRRQKNKISGEAAVHSGPRQRVSLLKNKDVCYQAALVWGLRDDVIGLGRGDSEGASHCVGPR